ncbi:MAG: quinone oxidoreductase [Rickettsiales bacterium]|nr:quinone oxidoreductase [Rickettsiales bacterium]
MQAITLAKTGGPGNLKIKNVEDPKITKNDVIVKNNCVGVNFFDTAFRSGTYKLPELPAILGLEAAGTVEKIGSAVLDYKPGDRVAYATGGLGAYATKKAVNQNHLIPIPPSVTDEQAAACLHKGLMAHALLHRVYIATRAKRILVTSAAGGVGHILCQLARHLNLEIIGTVRSEEKAAFVKSLGCNHVINYKTQDIVAEVANITDHKGVGIVYDSVGKETLEKTISCLWPMGLCVSYGESSGAYKNFDLNHLVTNSLYITRPTMALYKSNRIELNLSASEVFAAITKGILKPKITTYDFTDVAKAHKDLESGETIGSLVLKVN